MRAVTASRTLRDRLNRNSDGGYPGVFTVWREDIAKAIEEATGIKRYLNYRKDVDRSTNLLGRSSWWKKRKFTSMFERDTMVMLHVMGILKIDDVEVGNNWEVPFKKYGKGRVGYIDFLVKITAADGRDLELIFEPHGERDKTILEYIEKRLKEYKGSKVEAIPHKYIFETRAQLREMIPSILTLIYEFRNGKTLSESARASIMKTYEEELLSKESEIAGLIAESEEETASMKKEIGVELTEESAIEEAERIIREDALVMLPEEELALVGVEESSEMVLAAAATERAEYRGDGPGTATYNETGDLITEATIGYLDEAQSEFLTDITGDAIKAPILLRIPVEVLDVVGSENAQSFLSALGKTPKGEPTNVVIELYSVVGRQFDYASYGIDKRAFTETRSRSNTITLFVTDKGESIGSQSLATKIGDYDLKPTQTILMPVGLYNEGKDLSGLVRSAVLGLRLMKIAGGKASDGFVKDTLSKFRTLCESSSYEAFDLTEKDILDIAMGTINDIVHSLKKLIRLLPITPIDAENLRRIFEQAKKALTSA